MRVGIPPNYYDPYNISSPHDYNYPPINNMIYPFPPPNRIPSISPNIFSPFPRMVPAPSNLFPPRPIRSQFLPIFPPPPGIISGSSPNLCNPPHQYLPGPRHVFPPYPFNESRRMIFHPDGPQLRHLGSHGYPLNVISKKKTIDNLGEFIEEKEITQTILEKGEQKNCRICLEDFVLADKIIYLPCFHYYHSKCIKTWVNSSNKCPICNNEIKLQ